MTYAYVYVLYNVSSMTSYNFKQIHKIHTTSIVCYRRV